MGKEQQQHNNAQDGYGQLAGAIGTLVIAAGVLGAIKDKTGLGWTATVLLTAGTLVLLGYVAWRVKTTVARRWASKPAEKPSTVVAQESTQEAMGAAQAPVPVHPELTAALVRTGAIGRDEVIALAEVRTEMLPGIGTKYTFLVPEAHTHEVVSKRLGPIASMLGVTRLHLKLETSRRTEREVTLLKLDDPPFSKLFAAPTREQIRAFDGVPLGHEITGVLGGVKTMEAASMLIAGMTQTGKTTLVNGLITCLLVAYGSDFDLYLLDGKMCGLTDFAKIAVRYEASDDPAVLESMLDDVLPRVEGRYVKLQEAKRNRTAPPKFRRVFFIVDEAADFYVDDGTPKSKELVRRVEEKSRKFVAKALECGISAIMLTQRPDKDAIPVKVRAQFKYRVCLYVDSEGAAKVALGDSYFTTVAPIEPQKMDPDIKGQAVLYANGASTLLRGFHFENDFMWEVIDEVHDARTKEFVRQPESPRKQAIDLMHAKGVKFLPNPDLANALGVTETDPIAIGKELTRILEVQGHRGAKGVRGYLLADLTAAQMAEA